MNADPFNHMVKGQKLEIFIPTTPTAMDEQTAALAITQKYDICAHKCITMYIYKGTEHIYTQIHLSAKPNCSSSTVGLNDKRVSDVSEGVCVCIPKVKTWYMYKVSRRGKTCKTPPCNT